MRKHAFAGRNTQQLLDKPTQSAAKLLLKLEYLQFIFHFVIHNPFDPYKYWANLVSHSSLAIVKSVVHKKQLL